MVSVPGYIDNKYKAIGLPLTLVYTLPRFSDFREMLTIDSKPGMSISRVLARVPSKVQHGDSKILPVRSNTDRYCVPRNWG